jgi:chromate transporter
MISKECVDEERWVSQETFKKTLAVYQVLPGPEAHELCVYFGRLRGGKLGGFLAGLGFMLPGFLLMLGLSILYEEAGLDTRFEELFYGLKAAVGALVAMAIVRLGRKFIDDVPLAVIAVAAFGLTLGLELSFVLVLLASGLAYELWKRAGTGSGALLSVGLLPLVVGLEAGLLTFGGAYTAVPVLHDSAVSGQEWLTEDEFLDGIALGGILPAPMVIFSTFVGYQAGGLDGSLLMTLGVFLPAFVFPIFFHRQLVAVAENPHIRPFLLGVAAGVIGLIGAVTVDILESSVVDVPSGVLAAGAFAALYRFQAKLAVLYVVLGCGVLGALWQLTA